MTHKSIILGLSAIGAIVLAGNANAQVLGVTGQVAAPVPAIPAAPPSPAVPEVRPPSVPAAPNAAAAGADASANTAGQVVIPVGTAVRNSAGVHLGTVMAPDPMMAASGRVAMKTDTGFITVPVSSLSMQGDVAISAEATADVARPTP